MTCITLIRQTEVLIVHNACYAPERLLLYTFPRVVVYSHSHASISSPAVVVHEYPLYSPSLIERDTHSSCGDRGGSRQESHAYEPNDQNSQQSSASQVLLV